MASVEAKMLCARLRRDHGVTVSPLFCGRALAGVQPGAGDIPRAVLDRFLEGDLAEADPVPVLPTGGAGPAILDVPAVLQIEVALDVSRAAYDQLTALRRDRDRSAAWERSRHGAPAAADGGSARRALKLKLSDGVTSILGFEIEPLPWLHTHTMPGSKIRLRPGTQIVDGQVLLTPHNCENVWQRSASPAEARRRYEDVLMRILGIEGEAERGNDAAQPDGDHAAQTVDLMQVELGARQSVPTHQATGDDDDFEDDDIMANIDMDAIEGGAAPAPPIPSSAVPRTALDHIDKKQRLDADLGATRREHTSTVRRNSATVAGRRDSSLAKAGDAEVALCDAKAHCSSNRVAVVTGRVATFIGGLAKDGGVWRLVLDLKAGGYTARVYMGDSILVGKLGMSVDQFKRRKKAGKKDAAEKAALAKVSSCTYARRLEVPHSRSSRPSLLQHFATAQRSFQEEVMKSNRFWLRSGAGGMLEVTQIA